MKQRARKLLAILPLLPLLMANSPAPRQEEYKDLEVTYVREESLYSYNFYHFNIKNTGVGYVDNLYLYNKNGSDYFSAYVEDGEILPPFNNILIEPGFDKEIVVATKNTIPESKEVQTECYSYYIDAEGVTFDGEKTVSYVSDASNVSSNHHVYKIRAFYDGDLTGNYNYRAVLKFVYDGASGCIVLEDIENLLFSTNEQIDLTKLTVTDVVMVRDTERHNYYNGIGINLENALRGFLIFLLVFGLLLSFGIFAAIFFPAMARRKRRNRLLQEQNNK